MLEEREAILDDIALLHREDRTPAGGTLSHIQGGLAVSIISTRPYCVHDGPHTIFGPNDPAQSQTERWYAGTSPINYEHNLTGEEQNVSSSPLNCSYAPV